MAQVLVILMDVKNIFRASCHESSDDTFSWLFIIFHILPLSSIAVHILAELNSFHIQFNQQLWCFWHIFAQGLHL